MVEWLTENWLLITVPVLAFLATYIVGLWLRRVLDNAFERWSARTKWEGSQLVMATVHRAFPFWFLILGVIIAVQVSVLPAEAKSITIRMMGSLLVLSLGWAVIILSDRYSRYICPE